MAETVTISTFLELRDNMSAGLQRIADALKSATKDAPKAQEALNNIAKQATANSRQVEKAKKDEEKAAARAAEMRRRIQINSAKLNSDAAQKEVNDQIKAQHRIDSFERTREMNRIIREEQAAKQKEREAARAVAEQKRIADQKAKQDQAMAFRAQQFETTREMNRIIQSERAAAKAMAAQARMDKEKERAAQRAAKNQEMLKERMAMAVVRLNQKLEADRKRAERQAEALARKEANAIIREAERAIREKRRIEREAAAAARRSAQKTAGAGGAGGASSEFGFLNMTGANVLAYGIVRAAGMAKTAVLGFYDSVIEKGQEYERALSATSSAMFTLGVSPSMRIAEAYSKQLYEIVRNLSAKLPGEAKEYIEVFQRTMPQAIMSGAKDMRKYADLVAQYSAVAIQRGVSAKVAASNLQIMLKGSAREQTQMAANLAVYTGKSVTELNKLSRAARFELYAKAIEKAAAGMGAMSDKAETIFGTLRSDIDYIFQIGGSPLFEAAKQNAMIIHEFFEKNKKSIMDTVSIISTGMGNFLTGSVTLLRDMVAQSEKIAATLGFLAPTTGEVTPTSLLKTLLFKGPFALIAERGRVELESRKEIERTGEKGEMARRIGLAKTYGMLEERYGMTVKSLEDVEALTTESQKLIKGGMFRGLGKTEQLALSEFLEYKGVEDLKIQEVHQALMASGVFKPTDLATAPAERASTVNDFRYSRFDIRQEFAEGFDPDRIAVAFATDLGKLADRKLSAATGGAAVGAH